MISAAKAWVDGWVVRNAANPIRVWPATREGVAIAVGGPVVFNPLGGAADARCFDLSLGTLLRSVAVGAAGRVASAAVVCP